MFGVSCPDIPVEPLEDLFNCHPFSLSLRKALLGECGLLGNRASELMGDRIEPFSLVVDGEDRNNETAQPVAPNSRPLGYEPSDRSATQTVPVSRVALLGKYWRFHIPSPVLHFGTRRVLEILVINFPNGKTVPLDASL